MNHTRLIREVEAARNAMEQQASRKPEAIENCTKPKWKRGSEAQRQLSQGTKNKQPKRHIMVIQGLNLATKARVSESPETKR